MIRSMTGYGRGEGAYEGVNITVELRAVNNRYLDCSVKMPRTYIFAEEALKERVQSKVGRGKVDVFVNIAHTGGEALSVTVNEELFPLHRRLRTRNENQSSDQNHKNQSAKGAKTNI